MISEVCAVKQLVGAERSITKSAGVQAYQDRLIKPCVTPRGVPRAFEV